MGGQPAADSGLCGVGGLAEIIFPIFVMKLLVFLDEVDFVLRKGDEMISVTRSQPAGFDDGGCSTHLGRGGSCDIWCCMEAMTSKSDEPIDYHAIAISNCYYF